LRGGINSAVIHAVVGGDAGDGECLGNYCGRRRWLGECVVGGICAADGESSDRDCFARADCFVIERCGCCGGGECDDVAALSADECCGSENELVRCNIGWRTAQWVAISMR
jgi:hypothetical protein